MVVQDSMTRLVQNNEKTDPKRKVKSRQKKRVGKLLFALRHLDNQLINSTLEIVWSSFWADRCKKRMALSIDKVVRFL